MTPRPAATLLVVRPGDRGFEVLMMERPARGLFGGMWVFPGGALEDIDRDGAHDVLSRPDAFDDVAWRTAALRETVEEVGLAVTDPPISEPVDAVGAEVFAAVRRRGARLAVDRLRLLSQWVTPRGLSTRYDARFYLTVVPDAPAPLARSAEVEAAAWVTAEEALDNVESGKWVMARPTLHHVRWLACFTDADAVWSAAARATGERVEPMIESDGSEVRVRLPAGAELP